MPPASGAVVQHFARSIRPARGPCQTLLINSLKKLTSVGRLRSKLETQLEASRSQNAGRSPRSRAGGLCTKYDDWLRGYRAVTSSIFRCGSRQFTAERCRSLAPSPPNRGDRALSSTMTHSTAIWRNAATAQFLPCQGWGRGFESLRPLQVFSQIQYMGRHMGRRFRNRLDVSPIHVATGGRPRPATTAQRLQPRPGHEI